MRILVIDDEVSVREAYARTFAPADPGLRGARLRALAADLFGDDEPAAEPVPVEAPFAVSYAAQGEEGVAMVAAALAEGEPYSVAFIDVRMPPGIDGKETARRIRALDRQINLVIVTAWSDHAMLDIAAVAGPADKLFYIAKPFGADEVRHMARALAQRWDHDTRQIAYLREKLAELAESEARAVRIAQHDFLTGAPNRMTFQRELVTRLAAGREGLMLAFVDLDRFKFVNDNFGHGAGDDLLVRVYARLRERAPPAALVARLGGDEFGVLFAADDLPTAQVICDELVAGCSGSFSVFGHAVQIGASCGVVDCATYPQHDAAELLRYADLALFAAKRGDERVRLFDAALDQTQRFRRAIEEGLVEAIARDELALHYQPIVERESLEVVGYEALLRWTSAAHGEVSPAVFIPIAEESALIHTLGSWVVERAFADAAHWPDKRISINLSARQLNQADLAERLAAAASRHALFPGRIQFEVTETALFHSTEAARTVLRQLRAVGFLVALDDFGTGYSTMFNLKSFAVDCIKVDRSFVAGIGKDQQSTAIINAIAYLARGLGLEIVAEGVETEIQYQMLRRAGCSHMQGYMFGKAQSVAVIECASQALASRSAAAR